jgi:hypothetical protein
MTARSVEKRCGARQRAANGVAFRARPVPIAQPTVDPELEPAPPCTQGGPTPVGESESGFSHWNRRWSV